MNDWEYVARVELGMSPDVFWNLTLWDWDLWMHKIKFDRKRRVEDYELARETQSHLEALIGNVNRDSRKHPEPFSPIDFFRPSWYKIEEVKDERTDEQILSKFPKKLKQNG